MKEVIDIFIEKGKDILCIKFTNIGGFDCIEKHLQLIKKYGYVWFGKIGNKPAEKTLNRMIEEKSNYILLKDSENAFLCEFEAFSEINPDNSKFPKYYQTEIMPTRNFSIWFKLVSIIQIHDLTILNDVVLKTSFNPILETASKSMASHFYTVTRKDIML